MSVMLMSRKSINLAFNTVLNLQYAAPVDWPPVNTMEQLRRFDPKYLARWSAIFNVRNYNRRYQDFLPNGYKWRTCGNTHVTRCQLAQAITTIQCLRYNLVDFYDKAPQYMVLKDLENTLINIFMDTSEEMKAAQWR